MKTKFSVLVVFIGAGGFAEAAAPGREGRLRRKK